VTISPHTEIAEKWKNSDVFLAAAIAFSQHTATTNLVFCYYIVMCLSTTPPTNINNMINSQCLLKKPTVSHQILPHEINLCSHNRPETKCQDG